MFANNKYQSKPLRRENLSFKAAPEKFYMEKMNFKTRGLFSDAKLALEPKVQEFYQGFQKLLDGMNTDKYYKVSHFFEPIIGFSTYALGSMFNFLRIPAEDKPAYALSFKEDGEKEQTIAFEDGTLKARFNPEDYGASLNGLTSTALETIISDNKLLSTEERLKIMINKEKQERKAENQNIRNEMNNIISSIEKLKEQIKKESEKNKQALLREINDLEFKLEGLTKVALKDRERICKLEDAHFPKSIIQENMEASRRNKLRKLHKLVTIDGWSNLSLEKYDKLMEEYDNAYSNVWII